MGIYLRKIHAARTPKSPSPGRQRPGINCVRARLVEWKERLWYIEWARAGKDAATAGAAKAIRRRYGEEKTCSCDVCALQTSTTVAVLKWACGEAEDLE
jgi:hypothetical protein